MYNSSYYQSHKMNEKLVDSSEYSMNHFNMFQPELFMQETEFENFISTIQASPIEKFCLDFECNHFTNSCSDLQIQQTLFGYNESITSVGVDTGTGIGGYDVMDPNSNMIWNQVENDVKVSEVFGDEDSCETGTTGNLDSPGSKRGGGAKANRSRTLISERRRRSGMKDKLYALRSLVPNITKMDKASIVGDAARYVQDLQTQARNLKAEIATIEESKNQKTPSQNPKKIHVSDSCRIVKKISKMDIFQVEEKGYYVKLVCNKGRGVAVSIHKALESITSFQVQSSNLATVGDNFELSFNLNVTLCEFDINLPNLKLWLAGAFLNQGFEFTTYPQ